MPSRDDDLLKRLLATFQVEAREHIDAIASGLVELEKAPATGPRRELLDTIFRSAHSLKGAARAVNVTEIESLCHEVESIFSALKRETLAPGAELFDLLHRTVDALGGWLARIDSPAPDSVRPPHAELVRALKRVLTAGPVSAAPGETAAAPALEPAVSGAEEKRGGIETVRVATAKLDTVLRQAEELLFVKQAAALHVAKLRQVHHGPSEWRKKWTRLRADVRVVEQSLKEKRGQGPSDPALTRILEFLDWNGAAVEGLETELTDLAREVAHDQRTVAAMVDNLLDEMLKVVMQPFSTLLDLFPRLVRELSRDQGKEVDLSIHGGDIEIDRRILEEMKDPLIHLLRNCLDHGIELPAERRRRGKPARGTITLTISARNGSHVELLLRDDGGGIDVAKVRRAAGKLQLLSPERAETLDEKEALPLIFQSGVSTSPMITDISGRGLGLAIVKEKVEKLNGALSVETDAGRGTTFRLVLPLTLARLHGVVVRAGERQFVLPTSHVERVARFKKEDVKTVENRETIPVQGQAVALAYLREVLALPAAAAAAETPDLLPVIVLTFANQRVAFVVDEVLNEQEVLVKTLGKQLVRVRNIGGATVLASGKVVPILDVPQLIQSAIHLSAAGGHAPAIAAPAVAAIRKSVLVAEDSITSRTLLKNILESAGYRVETAVDGVDALTKLRGGEFDLVVSDVDMPRLNGFGLTAKIRAEAKFAALPVILVTALDSRADREHGMDVGANAYIVKSSFDQSNLLEVVRRSI